MKTRNNLSEGERRLLFNMISYTIADLTPVKPFTEDQPPENNPHALKLWKAHLTRHREDMLNHATAMAFAVDGDPIVLRSGREMTFKDCLLELGLDNAEEIAERVRQQPEDFGREADILLKKLNGQSVKQAVDQAPATIHTLQAGSGFSLGF
ncbi:MAG: hypothetical protein ACYDB0_02650 [Acidithiobacillus sp.]